MEGLTTHFLQLKQLLYDFKPLIVVVSETHITSDIEESEYFIDGYKSFVNLSVSRHTGGVICYVKSHVKCQEVQQFSTEWNYWCTLLKVDVGHKHMIIGGVYRSPNGCQSDFLDFFQELFELEELCTNDIIILGDFNFDLLTLGTGATRLLDIIHLAGCKQIVKKPTRVTSHSETLIDLIITNTNIEEVERNFPKFTDHDITGTVINIPSEKVSKIIYSRCITPDKIDDIKIDLIQQNWNYTTTNADILYQTFVNNIKTSLDKIAPIQNKHYSETNGWIDEEVRNMQKERDKYYKRFQYTKNPIDFERYRQKRNEVVCMIRRKEKIFYEKKVDQCRNDSKKMWSTLKQLVSSTNKDTDISSLDIRSNDTSEVLNKFFIDSIEDIAKSVPSTDDFSERKLDVQGNIDPFPTITINKLHKVVNSLKNKATGDEVLTVSLMKDLFSVVGYPLLNLVNTCLQTGVLPAILKCSTVIPVPKISKPVKPEDLRPINLLPVVDKIIEILVHEHLTDYLSKQNILYANQSGFRCNHSTESACQLVCNMWKKDMDDGKIIISVFIDLKRAFETIDRQKLLYKCKNYGITGVVLKWLENYLSGRCQKTKTSGNYSLEMGTVYGVPQGSVLGPLLFILYVNDISLYLQQSFVNLFADDTLISVSGKNFEEIVEVMNEELGILNKWLMANKLKLNSLKTKCMILGSNSNVAKFNRCNFVIEIGDTKISYVYEIKYLGIIFDPQLKFSKHIDYLCKKIGKKVGYFYRVCRNLSLWCRKIVYNTIIFPHFSYCMSVFISCSDEQIHRLQLLQNKAMRVILRCNRYTSITSMLETLNFLNVRQLITESYLVLIYKIVNRQAPKYLTDYLVKRSELIDYNLRYTDHYQIQRFSTSAMEKTLFIEGLREYNKLPLLVKTSPNIVVFKTRLRQMYSNI